MTAEDWVDAFARETGLTAPTPDQMDDILRLASIAAHASERKAAPIACFVAGVSGRPMTELLEAAQRLSRGGD